MKQKDHSKIDFFVIGAQKCATSWLYYCLRDHPQVSLPRDKDEANYLGGEKFLSKGSSWYFDRFKVLKPGQTRGDVSVDYLYDFKSASALGPYVEKPKFIVSLRHPVDRMVSSYDWLVRRNALDDLPITEGLGFLFEKGFSDIPGGDLGEVVKRSFYAEGLSEFIKIYGESSIFMITYEDIQIDPLSRLRGIYGFLGVDDAFVPPSLSTRPKQNAYNSKLRAAERMTKSKRKLLSWFMAKVFNSLNQYAIKIGVDGKPTISKETLDHLLELFEQEIIDTREVLSRLPLQQRPDDEVLKKLWKVSALEGKAEA